MNCSKRWPASPMNFLTLLSSWPETEKKTPCCASGQAPMASTSAFQFPGYVGGMEKAKLLHGSTVFALPTYSADEGMPIALLEAMGAGKPLLTAKAGAIQHIVSDPENGVILEEVSADTIEKGLRRLLSDPDYSPPHRPP